MALQVGTWTANVGGIATSLLINGVDAQGNVKGSVGSPAPALSTGYWDEDAQRLMLLQGAQVFVGYLFTDPVNLTGVRGSVVFTLVGSVETFGVGFGWVGPSPTARRSTVGWYAQIGVE